MAVVIKKNIGDMQPCRPHKHFKLNCRTFANTLKIFRERGGVMEVKFVIEGNLPQEWFPQFYIKTSLLLIMS